MNQLIIIFLSIMVCTGFAVASDTPFDGFSGNHLVSLQERWLSLLWNL